jgi:hypothetical protein
MEQQNKISAYEKIITAIAAAVMVAVFIKELFF